MDNTIIKILLARPFQDISRMNCTQAAVVWPADLQRWLRRGKLRQFLGDDWENSENSRTKVAAVSAGNGSGGGDDGGGGSDVGCSRSFYELRGFPSSLRVLLLTMLRSKLLYFDDVQKKAHDCRILLLHHAGVKYSFVRSVFLLVFAVIRRFPYYIVNTIFCLFLLRCIKCMRYALCYLTNKVIH